MRNLVFVLLLSFCLPAMAQTSNTEEILRRVADRIVQNTSFKYTDTKSGRKYDSVVGMSPDSAANIRTDSRYNRWEYVNGVITVGMMRMADLLHDPKYAAYSAHNFDFIFSGAPFFEPLYQQGRSVRSEYAALFRMGSLDDCGAMSAGLTDVYTLYPKKEYRAYLDKAANYISTQQLRLPDRTLSRPVPHNMTLWADDMYMSIPFLARMGKLTGDQRYFDDAILQVENFNKYLYDPSTGLYFHCYYSDNNMNGVAHWGRCNGWIALATVDLLANLPANHPKHQELVNFLLRQIAGFSRYQDQSGLWHQLLDKPDSYLESSVTAMFTYAVARAVNEGWINITYMNIARDGWKGLQTKVTADGQLQDVCIGTGIEDDIRFYYNRPAQLNDSHGLGAFLLAGAEMLRFERSNRKMPPTP